MARGFRFGAVVKRVEKFWEIGSGSIYMRCYKIGHKYLKKCEIKPKKYMICARKHRANEDQYGVAKCNKGREKLCIDIVT